MQGKRKERHRRGKHFTKKKKEGPTPNRLGPYFNQRTTELLTLSKNTCETQEKT